ncbi:hypothetical protein L596_015491 [Steinernema carpocapsae]|uniref:Uncharacterized protein n=1 Tax=Steinernema carpocapsae TaxID=34508 RepID=A0A4U5NG55_STECR|nr:hypothetical protein L596_015491 [Steinernema carpocapsae]
MSDSEEIQQQQMENFHETVVLQEDDVPEDNEYTYNHRGEEVHLEDENLGDEVHLLDEEPVKVAATEPESESEDEIKPKLKVEFDSEPEVIAKDEEAESVQLEEEIVGEIDVEDVKPDENLGYEVHLEDDAQREEPEVVKLEDEESRKMPEAEEDDTVNNNEPSPLKEERKWPPTLSKQKSVVKSGEPDEDDWAKKNISKNKVNDLIARFQSGAAFNNNNQQQTCSSTYKCEYGVSGKVGQIQQSRFN